jgi:hypothetical protein
MPVAELPTIWLDRQAGVSNFKLAQWIPKYLRWYRFAFGPRLHISELRDRTPAPPQEAATADLALATAGPHTLDAGAYS